MECYEVIRWLASLLLLGCSISEDNSASTLVNSRLAFVTSFLSDSTVWRVLILALAEGDARSFNILIHLFRSNCRLFSCRYIGRTALCCYVDASAISVCSFGQFDCCNEFSITFWSSCRSYFILSIFFFFSYRVRRYLFLFYRSKSVVGSRCDFLGRFWF